ncbi:DUF7537 family lipoprotein [Haloarcula rara]|uniref:DUF7537 family lipoprotein n=1 Tax=Haloarcula rara TaxID=3033387 RepID=UPI0023E834E0|nr:hypothetical protein [Halomicroarcula sp. SHR3]
MRTVLTVLVVVTVLLAGCNTGGSVDTPTGTTTGTESVPTVEEPNKDLSGGENGSVTNSSALLGTFYNEGLSGYANLDFSVETSDINYTIGYQNDTASQIYEVSTADQRGTTVYYVHSGTDAVRNTASGEVTYREQPNASYALLVPKLYLDIIPALEWDSAGTTTVDGNQRSVLESSSINETAADNLDYPLSLSGTTADARLTVDSHGIIRSGELSLPSEGGSATITFTLDKSESISVTAPDWYDEAEATNATAE